MKFKRLNRLGEEGGQADVWLGEDELGRSVALKYLRITASMSESDTNERARFTREVKCMTTLKHAGIIPVIASNLIDERPFFVMPLAQYSLRALLNENPEGLSERGLRFFSEVLEAMQFAHHEGVIHRDLKPENILIMEGPWDNQYAVVSDFGLGRRFVSGTATLTQTNVGLGTIGYSAPEQFLSAHSADERADIYALGCILYEVLVGKPLFVTRDIDLAPAKFRYLIYKATKHAPNERYESISDLQREFSLLGEEEKLQPPSERARELIASILEGEPASAADLVRTLLDGSDDLELYLQVLTSCPAPVVGAIAISCKDEFRSIIENYCEKASGDHPFSFTDKIADFLEVALNSTEDLRVREVILRRLLILGYEHNRWYVRNKFVKVAVPAMHSPTAVPVIQQILREDGDRLDFVRNQLLDESIPLVIRQEIAA